MLPAAKKSPNFDGLQQYGLFLPQVTCLSVSFSSGIFIPSQAVGTAPFWATQCQSRGRGKRAKMEQRSGS